MAEDNPAGQPRPRGEAAWKAERAATEQRNDDARKRAHAHQPPSQQAALGRERRLAVAESAQLAALNLRLDAERKQG